MGSLSYFWLTRGLLCWIASSAAHASDKEIQKLEQEVLFHIEQGPLESALIQFSRQAELQILLAIDSMLNMTASCLYGRRMIGDALTELLKSTTLAYTAIGNTVTVQVAVKASNPENF